MPGYLVIIVILGAWLMAACIAAAIVKAIGVGRLGRLLRIDVRDGDS